MDERHDYYLIARLDDDPLYVHCPHDLGIDVWVALCPVEGVTALVGCHMRPDVEPVCDVYGLLDDETSPLALSRDQRAGLKAALEGGGHA